MKRAALNMKALAVVLALISAIGAACAADGGPASTVTLTAEDVGLRVVTTVSPITSLVENIGGTRISLEGIVPEGTNSHTFEPVPSVARVLSQADIIILNGLFLEEPSLRLAEANKKEGAVILTLGDKAIAPDEWVYDFSFPESGGHPNPHLWTDPILALKYAELIRDEFIRLDPDNSDYYAENFSSFEIRIEDLDERITAAVATIPEGNRKLLTYHDSFPYFGSRYGMEIIGAVQPSDFTELSAREVANLIDQVRDEGVPAIFGSEVFPSPVMEQVAKESGARFIDELRDDDLPGQGGDPAHTYFGLMVANMKAMIPALGGSARAFEGFDTGNVFEGESRGKYPQ
jgi:ABC-type Zn uptake system ZnuABC Zn-binding protein ZnuA